MTIAANRPLKGARSRVWASRALAWWVGELRACRDDIRRFVAVRGRGVTIEAGERYWLLRQGARPIGQIDRETGEAGRLAQLLPAAGRRAVVVEIPPERTLAKTILLPGGADRQIDRILGFEIARHFPFPAERVYFQHRVIGAKDASGSVSVEIVAVPREVLDGICAAVAEAGLRLAAVAISAAPPSPPLFLPPQVFGAAQRGASRSTRVLAVAAAVAVLGALASWPLAQDAALRSLDRELAALKPGAEAALRTESTARRAGERNAAILALRGGRPPLVGVLDTLSRDLPDGAWLLSLSVAGGDVVLDGLAASAAATALALEKGHNFSDIVFRSPISRDASGFEHFQLGARLSGAKP